MWVVLSSLYGRRQMTQEKTGEIKDNQTRLCSVSEGQAWRYSIDIGWLWCVISRRKVQARRPRPPERALAWFAESGVYWAVAEVKINSRSANWNAILLWQQGRQQATSYSPSRSSMSDGPLAFCCLLALYSKSSTFWILGSLIS